METGAERWDTQFLLINVAMFNTDGQGDCGTTCVILDDIDV
jgi:hypothetical protein